MSLSTCSYFVSVLVNFAKLGAKYSLLQSLTGSHWLRETQWSLNHGCRKSSVNCTVHASQIWNFPSSGTAVSNQGNSWMPVSETNKISHLLMYIVIDCKSSLCGKVLIDHSLDEHYFLNNSFASNMYKIFLFCEYCCLFWNGTLAWEILDLLLQTVELSLMFRSYFHK